MLNALPGLPALTSIALDSGGLEEYIAEHEIFRDPRIEKIICRGWKRSFPATMEAIGVPDVVKGRVVYEATDEMRAVLAMHVPFRSPVADFTDSCHRF